jgi:hypothetical protein
MRLGSATLRDEVGREQGKAAENRQDSVYAESIWYWPSPRWEAGDWHGQNLLLLFMSMRWGAQAEWQWQGKTDRLGEKPVAVPLCLPQIPHGLTQARFRASTVRGRQWTAWAIESALSEFFPFGNTRQILKDVSKGELVSSFIMNSAYISFSLLPPTTQFPHSF